MRRRVHSNDLGLIVDKAQTVVKQRYIGDINLIPPRQPLNALRVLSNPSLDDVRAFVRAGEKTTWPKLWMIGNTTRISRTFRACRERLDRLEERTLNRLQMVATV